MIDINQTELTFFFIFYLNLLIFYFLDLLSRKDHSSHLYLYEELEKWIP